MSMFSRILSSQIHWDKASPEQKLDALGDLPPNDPQLEKLALHDADERVRRKAFERMEAEAQLRLVGVVQAGDESYLATCIGGNLDDQVLSSGDVVAQLISAPSTFRVALIGAICASRASMWVKNSGVPFWQCCEPGRIS